MDLDIVEVTDPFRLRVGTFSFANALFVPFKHLSRWILMKCPSDLSKCQSISLPYPFPFFIFYFLFFLYLLRIHSFHGMLLFPPFP